MENTRCTKNPKNIGVQLTENEYKQLKEIQEKSNRKTVSDTIRFMITAFFLTKNN